MPVNPMPVKRSKYKMIIAYEGTRFGGWQVQPNSVTIQELIESAIQTITREKTKVIASGRTDAGVHAKGQTAHFEAKQNLDLFRFRYSLNGLLPPEIRILSIESAPNDFHARFSAKKKIYHYNLYLGSVMPPFKRFTHTHVRCPLDLPLLKTAAKSFIGTHNFKAFSNESHLGSAANSPVKTLYELNCRHDGDVISLEFVGSGFLYKMVRNIVGTLLDVARGKTKLDEIPKILESEDRTLAGPAAPPEGLFLISVDY